MLRPLVPSILARSLKLALNFLSGVLDLRITFTRADATSCATYFNQYGLLVTQGANTIANSSLQGIVVSGSGTYPTGWGQTGSYTTNITTVPNIGAGLATNIIRFRVATAGGYQGIQVSGALSINTLTISAYLRIPTGLTALDCTLYVSGGTPSTTVLASAATLNAQPKDTWIRYSQTIAFTSIGSNYLAFISTVSTAGCGWDMCQPQVELGSVTNVFSPTYGTVTSGPRFDYDPTTPLDSGARGLQLVTNGNFSSSTGWVTSGTASINTSLNEGVFVASNDKLSQTATTFTSGLTYSVSITLLGSGSLTLYAGLGTQLIANPTTASAFTYIFTATTTASLYIVSNGYVGAIQNVSVQQVIPATNGTELITNSNFASGSTGWTPAATLPDTITFAAGSVTLNNTTDGAYIGITQPTSGLQLGATYRFQVVVSSITTSGNGLTLDFTGAQTTSIINSMPASGTYTGTVTITGVNPGIELKRLGTGTTVNATVTLISCQQVVFTPKGLLIEQASTNLYLNSHTPTAGTWTGTCGRSQNAVGPDGTTSAWTVTAVSGSNSTLNNYTSLNTSTTYTRTMIAKAGTTNPTYNLFFEYLDVDVLNGYSYTQFNLSTGAIGGTATSGAYMHSIGNGWWICGRTFTTQSTYTTNTPRADVNYIDTYGSGASGNTTLFVYNTQIEANSFATSTILTGAGTVTRAIDSAVISGTNFSSWHNQTTGTFVADADSVCPINYYPVVYCVSNAGSSSDRIMAFVTPAATLSSADVRVDVGGTNYLNNGAAGIATNGTLVQHGFAYSAGSNAVAGNGTVVDFGAFSIPTVTQMNIGVKNDGITSPLNGHIRSLNYYNTRLPDNTLQALT